MDEPCVFHPGLNLCRWLSLKLKSTYDIRLGFREFRRRWTKLEPPRQILNLLSVYQFENPSTFAVNLENSCHTDATSCVWRESNSSPNEPRGEVVKKRLTILWNRRSLRDNQRYLLFRLETIFTSIAENDVFPRETASRRRVSLKSQDFHINSSAVKFF